MNKTLAILAASAVAFGSVAAQAAQHGDDQSAMTAQDGSQPGDMMGQGGMGSGGSMMGQGGMGHGMMLNMMLAMMDTNSDGTLSLDEVQAVHARMFEMADEDGDGQLTPDEIQNFMQGGGMMAPQAQ